MLPFLDSRMIFFSVCQNPRAFFLPKDCIAIDEEAENWNLNENLNPYLYNADLAIVESIDYLQPIAHLSFCLSLFESYNRALIIARSAS